MRRSGLRHATAKFPHDAAGLAATVTGLRQHVNGRQPTASGACTHFHILRLLGLSLLRARIRHDVISARRACHATSFAAAYALSAASLSPHRPRAFSVIGISLFTEVDFLSPPLSSERRRRRRRSIGFSARICARASARFACFRRRHFPTPRRGDMRAWRY